MLYNAVIKQYPWAVDISSNVEKLLSSFTLDRIVNWRLWQFGLFDLFDILEIELRMPSAQFIRIEIFDTDRLQKVLSNSFV